MKFPVTFNLFETSAPIHFFFETLAFVVGYQIYKYNRKGIVDAISDMHRLYILLGAMIGALVGSRLIAVLETPEMLNHLTFLSIYQNKTVAGGFLGGLFGVEIAKKMINVKIASGDIYVIPILVALIIGRIGCFLSGIAEPTFGVKTSFFMGMNLGDGLQRHPVSLYEIIFSAFLLILFYIFKNKRLINGDRFKLFMILYFLYRFLVEFIKPYKSLFLDLSSIQLSSLLIFVYYAKFLARLLLKKVK